MTYLSNKMPSLQAVVLKPYQCSRTSHAVQEIAAHIEIIQFILKTNLNVSIIFNEKLIHVHCRLICSVTNHYKIFI